MLLDNGCLISSLFQTRIYGHWRFRIKIHFGSEAQFSPVNIELHWPAALVQSPPSSHTGHSAVGSELLSLSYCRCHRPAGHCRPRQFNRLKLYEMYSVQGAQTRVCFKLRLCFIRAENVGLACTWIQGIIHFPFFLVDWCYAWNTDHLQSLGFVKLLEE